MAFSGFHGFQAFLAFMAFMAFSGFYGLVMAFMMALSWPCDGFTICDGFHDGLVMKAFMMARSATT